MHNMFRRRFVQTLATSSIIPAVTADWQDLLRVSSISETTADEAPLLRDFLIPPAALADPYTPIGPHETVETIVHATATDGNDFDHRFRHRRTPWDDDEYLSYDMVFTKAVVPRDTHARDTTSRGESTVATFQH